MKSENNHVIKELKHSDHWKMFKVGRTWVFSCMAVLTMLGAGSAVATSTVSAAEEAPQAQVAEADEFTVNPVTANDTTITGMAAPGELVEVFVGSKNIGSGHANADGSFELSIEKQPAGTNIELSSLINGSFSTIEVTVSEGGTEVVATKPTINTAKAGDTQVSGTGNAGDTISLTVDGGTPHTAIVAANGTWTVSGLTAFKGGESLSAIASRAGATDSAAATATVATSTPEVVVTTPTFDKATEGDLKVSGTGTAGNTITLTIDGVASGTAVVGSDKTWSITTPALKAGANLSAIASQAGGKDSSPATSKVQAKTTTNLTLTSVDPVNDASTTVTGNAGPEGATIEVRDTSDNTKAPIATGKVSADGSYSVTIKPQVAGTILYVRAVSGNNYTDDKNVTVSVAENVLTVNPVSPGDRYLTGTAKAGNLITASAPGGQIGSVAADDNGEFTIPIVDSLFEGETITVISRDPNNNNHLDATYKIIVGNTADELGKTRVVSSTVKLVHGITAPGASVRILDDNGTLVSNAVADAQGKYEIAIPAKLPDGSAPVIGTNLTLIASVGTVDSPEKSVTLTAEITAHLISSGNVYGVYGQVTPDANLKPAYNNVYLQNADGRTVGIASINDDGSFIIILPTSVSAGDELTLYAQNDNDPNQRSNTSLVFIPKATIFNAKPTTQNIEGYVIDEPAQTEAIVYARDSKGNLVEQPLGTGVVDDNGYFNIKLNDPLPEGVDYVVVFGLETNNPVKIPISASVTGSIDPIAVGGSYITGVGVPGDWVTVQNVTTTDNRSFQRIQIPESGQFSIELSKAAAKGDTFIVSFVTPEATAGDHLSITPEVTQSLRVVVPYAGS